MDNTRISNDDNGIMVDNSNYSLPVIEFIPNPDMERAKVKINGIEVTDIKSWERVLNSIIELRKQNNDLRRIYKNTYKKLFENGNDELARYFMAQIDDCPTFYVEPAMDYYKEYYKLKDNCKKATEFMEDNWITYEDSKQFTEFDEELPVFIKEINQLYEMLRGDMDD